jgi:Xaa-Pro aminopeptidase
MDYLYGFRESAHERFLVMAVAPDGRTRLICPALTVNQAKRVGIDDVVGWADGEDPLLHANQLVRDFGLEGKKVAVDNEMPAALLLRLMSAFPTITFLAGQEILAKGVRRKAGDELERLQRAATIADEAWDEVWPTLKAGMTEREVSGLLSSAMARKGGKPTFSIIAAGANSAEPHHETDDTMLQIGDVVICDFGCEVEGYQSDITRVVAIGEASEEARRVYEIVMAAHKAARDVAKAGVTAGEVDEAARAIIREAGFGPEFCHRTGHGIGTKGHEEPYIIGGSDVILAERDCFSIEPGIYLEGRFGVRIENIVTITPGGLRSFNAEPSPVLLVVG